MTQDLHNLDDDVTEHFEFVLKGKRYKMRYPTTEETEQSRDKIKTLKKKYEKDVDKSIQAVEDFYQEWMYSFISKVDEDAPDIKTALLKSNVKLVKNFSSMIESEFGE